VIYLKKTIASTAEVAQEQVIIYE